MLRHAKISHLVVFIDDLDRCSSEKVIETFETIKLFLNTPACTFVIGADPRKIEDAVGEMYKVSEDNRKRDFLEKIIQIPFVIPEQKIDDVVCYVGMLIVAGYVQQGSWTELMKSRAAFLTSADGIEKTLRAWPAQNRALFSEIAAVEAELDEIFPYVRNLFHALRGNPRQIKRFLNILSLRRRLAKANNLVIHLQLLIKLAVLEYTWKDFFDSIIDTVDPLTGSCELFEAIAKAAEGNAGEAPGKLVTDALAQPALVHYLNREPVLKSTDDLRPYLFLAQTSLAKEKPEPVASLDEQAKRMARNIGSDDRMRARASARQAAAQDGETAALVVRILSQDLAQATNLTVQTHIVTGLIEICRRHPAQYTAATKALEKLTPPFAQALQIAGNTLISDAQAAAVAITPALRDSFAPKTKLASALAGKKRTSTKEFERYLDATRSTLLYARKVLLVEGPAEQFVIPPLVKKVLDIDLDEEGIAVVPIFGTHFSSYAKLFGPGVIQKKCAILTDGDLAPSDADPNVANEDGEDEPAPERQDLNALRGAYVEVFTCQTTFERELTLPGTLAMLAAATREIGAPHVANALQRLHEEAVGGGQPNLNAAKDSVLRTARKFGKARFAQVVSKHVASATSVPEYVRNALDWLMRDAPNR